MAVEYPLNPDMFVIGNRHNFTHKVHNYLTYFLKNER